MGEACRIAGVCLCLVCNLNTRGCHPQIACCLCCVQGSVALERKFGEKLQSQLILLRAALAVEALGAGGSTAAAKKAAGPAAGRG